MEVVSVFFFFFFSYVSQCLVSYEKYILKFILKSHHSKSSSFKKKIICTLDKSYILKYKMFQLLKSLNKIMYKKNL